jgi:hypothetical protein
MSVYIGCPLRPLARVLAYVVSGMGAPLFGGSL